ncbi:hypothetical protein THAOC_24489, partial [Thalassiosira oceanica]
MLDVVWRREALAALAMANDEQSSSRLACYGWAGKDSSLGDGMANRNVQCPCAIVATVLARAARAAPLLSRDKGVETWTVE